MPLWPPLKNKNAVFDVVVFLEIHRRKTLAVKKVTLKSVMKPI